MNYAAPIIDGYNAVVGTIVAVLSYILGDHWILFLAFLLLNVGDWLTGWMKSRLAGKENSVAGWKGVLKKLGYWLMVMVAFGASAVFIEIGKVIGIDLGITTLLGWFVLASLIINEIRSILENFVEAGYNVPAILVNGLKVADKVVNKDEDSEGRVIALLLRRRNGKEISMLKENVEGTYEIEGTEMDMGVEPTEEEIAAAESEEEKKE